MVVSLWITKLLPSQLWQNDTIGNLSLFWLLHTSHSPGSCHSPPHHSLCHTKPCLHLITPLCDRVDTLGKGHIFCKTGTGGGWLDTSAQSGWITAQGPFYPSFTNSTASCTDPNMVVVQRSIHHRVILLTLVNVTWWLHYGYSYS
jgi:hypothetical protein